MFTALLLHPMLIYWWIIDFNYGHVQIKLKRHSAIEKCPVEKGDKVVQWLLNLFNLFEIFVSSYLSI